MAHISINRLHLPTELQDMVKDYALLTTEKREFIKLHKQIHLKICKSRTRYNQPNYMPKQWFYWNDYQCMFCTTCGKYKSRRYPIHNYNLIKCKC